MNEFYTLIVKGDPLEVQAKMVNIKYIVRARKEMGWKAFQSDETWHYKSMEDNNVCPVCKRHAARRVYNGTIIKVEFPIQTKTYGEIEWRAPNVHIHKRWLKGKCRCKLIWQDPMGTLERRLGKEMEMVSEGVLFGKTVRLGEFTFGGG